MVSDPFLVNSVKRRSATATTSVFCLIILTILLAVPITVLIIGTHYRDPRYCPIEPRISLFLIVHGSVSIGWIALAFVFVALTIIAARQSSITAGIPAVILCVILSIGTIFSLVWLIIGSVWTFSVHNRVIHEYDRINHFYLYTYCHPVLYKFTFVYLIVSYVLMAIQCGCLCCCNPFSSRQQT